MFKPWVAIPADKVHVSLPTRMTESEVRIMFTDTKTIDDVIEQLYNLRQFVKEKEG